MTGKAFQCNFCVILWFVRWVPFLSHSPRISSLLLQGYFLHWEMFILPKRSMDRIVFGRCSVLELVTAFLIHKFHNVHVATIWSFSPQHLIPAAAIFFLEGRERDIGSKGLSQGIHRGKCCVTHSVGGVAAEFCDRNGLITVLLSFGTQWSMWQDF